MDDPSKTAANEPTPAAGGSGKLNPRATPFVAPKKEAKKETLEIKLPYATVCDGCGMPDQPPGEQWTCCANVARTILWVDPSYVNAIYGRGGMINPPGPAPTPAMEEASTTTHNGSGDGNGVYPSADSTNPTVPTNVPAEIMSTETPAPGDTSTIADTVVAKFKRLRATCSFETARAEKYEQLYRNLQEQLKSTTPTPRDSPRDSPEPDYAPPPENVTLTTAPAERVNQLTAKRKPVSKSQAEPKRATSKAAPSSHTCDSQLDSDGTDSDYAPSSISAASTCKQAEPVPRVPCGWARWRDRWSVAYKLMPHMIWHKRVSSGDAMWEVMRELLADLEAIECECDVEFVRGIWAVMTQLLPQVIRLDNKPHTEFFVKMLVQLDVQVLSQPRCGV